MDTYLETQLLPIDHMGGYLLLHGVTNLDVSKSYRENTEHAGAATGILGESRATDITNLLFEPRPASEHSAEDHLATALRQQQSADLEEGDPQLVRYMKECALKGRYSAAVARTDQLWLPSSVGSAGDGSVVVSTLTDNQSIVRHVHCKSQETLSEYRFKVKPGDPKIKEYCQWLSVTPDSNLLINKIDLRLAQKQPPQVRCEERSLAGNISTVSATDPILISRAGLVACGAKVWVSCSAYDDRGSVVSLLELGTGRLIETIKLANAPTSVAVSADDTKLLFGMSSGRAWLVDRSTGKMRKFTPHIGSAKEDCTSVQISRSGEFFVSESRGQYVVTSLEDGTSASLGEPKVQIQEGKPFEGHPSRTKITPSIAVLGDRIACWEDGEISELTSTPGDLEDHFVSEAGRKGARKPVRVNRKDPIEETLRKARLDDREANLLELYSPSATVNSKKLGKRGWSQPEVAHAPALGASRLGGWPDLPAQTEWPRSNGRPMAFLAQLNLAEACSAQPDLRLPKQGLLSFFLGCLDETYTKDPDLRERFMVDIVQDNPVANDPGWAVLYTADGSSLSRRELSETPLPELFDPSLVKFKAVGKSFADVRSAHIESLGLSASERADYIEMTNQLQRSNENHQLLGHPTLIQFTPPELFVAKGSDDVPFDRQSAEYKKLATEAFDWTLLLQLTSDDHADFVWGDAGNFYFYIKRSDLADLDFSDTRIFFEN